MFGCDVEIGVGLWVIGVWVIGVGLWISAGGFFFWVIGERCGVWVISVGLWCLVFDGLGAFFFFLGVDGRLWVASGGGGVRCV